MMKSNRLAGDVAIVTGAASGLDRGVAFELAMNGAVVACADVNDSENEKTVQLIREAGGDAFAVHMDIGNTQSVKDAFKQVYDKEGKITILINGAAVSRFSQLPECSDEEWEFVMNINCTGVFRTMREAHSYMKKSGGGRIVNISSTSGKSGGNWSGAHYVAAKAAVIGLARYGAGYFSKDNIRCNAVCPGVADTPLTADADKSQTDAMLKKIPMGRKATPEDIAGVVLFLVSEESQYVTGISVDVTGGRYIYNN